MTESMRRGSGTLSSGGRGRRFESFHSDHLNSSGLAPLPDIKRKAVSLTYVGGAAIRVPCCAAPPPAVPPAFRGTP